MFWFNDGIIATLVLQLCSKDQVSPSTFKKINLVHQLLFSDQICPYTDVILHNTRLLHSLCGYPTMTLIHYMTTFFLTHTIYDNFCYLLLKISYDMIWQEGREAPLFVGLHGSYGFAMCSSSTHFFIKYLTLEFSS